MIIISFTPERESELAAPSVFENALVRKATRYTRLPGANIIAKWMGISDINGERVTVIVVDGEVTHVGVRREGENQ